MSAFLPGDLVEISIAGGVFHVQVTHLHRSYPEVVRVFPGIRQERGDAISAESLGDAVFVAMVPLTGPTGKPLANCSRVGIMPVPAAARRFPTFKTTIRGRDGRIAYWWFWDGEALRFEEEPGAALLSLPDREILTFADIAARLADGDRAAGSP
jgi:hypothetical protein